VDESGSGESMSCTTCVMRTGQSAGGRRNVCFSPEPPQVIRDDREESYDTDAGSVIIIRRRNLFATNDNNIKQEKHNINVSS